MLQKKKKNHFITPLDTENKTNYESRWREQ